ncbi:hypothetical protein RMATCC62417_03139 [Rhizopus microsporus]|nr:hypothetical protein RMATCC62417_03139 [Rhizopus microsporus]
MDFKSYFAAHKSYLTEENKKRRLRWVLDHVDWTQEQWESVIWSDESRFTVKGYDGGARVICKVGERYEARHVKPTTKWGHECVMIRSCFWARGFGPLVIVDGPENQGVYIDILAKSFHPCFKKLRGALSSKKMVQAAMLVATRNGGKRPIK